MKISRLIWIAAAGGGLLFTSCVDPYYGGGAVTTTTYSPGYAVTSLPPGYNTVVVGGTRYYRHNNVYYRPRGNGYVVVRSPYGDRDRDGIPNRFDRPNRQDGPFDRRDGTPGRTIQYLPGGYKRVTHGGRTYYRAGDTYYQSRGNGYVIVPRPF